jgi:hypothetical protein
MIFGAILNNFRPEEIEAIKKSITELGSEFANMIESLLK